MASAASILPKLDSRRENPTPCGATETRAEAAATDVSPEVFAAIGLLGSWSPGCSSTPSANNPRVTWEVREAEVDHNLTFDGRTAALRDEVIDAADEHATFAPTASA